MKASFSLIFLFFLFSCNNSPEHEEETVDSTDTISVVQPIPTQPIVSPEERLLNNLQKFDKGKVDSISIEDILEIVKDILEALHEESESDDWEKAKEHYEKTESTMKQTEKGTESFNNNLSEFKKIRSKIDEHRLEELDAEKHLKRINSESRWEKLRELFKRNLNDGEYSQFTSEQQNDFKQILKEWDEYKWNNKLQWYRNGVHDLEDLFFYYSKSRGKVKAAWGYMIQQVDWDGAVNYYTNIAPDAKAMGKPYYMLKYYYNTINKGSLVEDLYDNTTDKFVGDLCPPTH